MFYRYIAASGTILIANKNLFIQYALLALHNKVGGNFIFRHFRGNDIDFPIGITFKIAKAGINLASVAIFHQQFGHAHFKNESCMLQKVYNLFWVTVVFFFSGIFWAVSVRRPI